MAKAGLCFSSRASMRARVNKIREQHRSDRRQNFLPAGKSERHDNHHGLHPAACGF